MANFEYGMLSQGFVPKRLVDINNDMLERVEAIQDPKTGEFPFANASGDTILTQLVGIFSNALSECWEAAYDASIQFNPLYNTGAGQSGTVQLNGIVRKPGSETIIICTCSGAAGTLITQGSLIGDRQGTNSYQAMANYIIGTNGTVEGRFQCTTKGAIDPAVGSINTIQTATAGWYSVSNTSTSSVGTPEETDDELRKRQQLSTSLTSYRQIEAIYSAIIAVDGVTYCRVYQNALTNPEDSRGIPYKEISPVVVGGEPEDIANAMFLRMPVTIQGYGNTLVTLRDRQNQPYNIRFMRPTMVPIFVDITIRVTYSAVFPSNYAELIKQSIVDYSVYDIMANTGFPPGEPVIRTRLFTPINDACNGFSIVNMTIGTSAEAQGKVDIPIDWNEASEFTVDNITVTLVD